MNLSFFDFKIRYTVGSTGCYLSHPSHIYPSLRLPNDAMIKNELVSRTSHTFPYHPAPSIHETYLPACLPPLLPAPSSRQIYLPNLPTHFLSQNLTPLYINITHDP